MFHSSYSTLSLSSSLLSSLLTQYLRRLSIFILSSMWLAAILYVLWYLMCYSAFLLSSATHFLYLLLYNSFRVDNTEIYFHSFWIIRVSSQSIICIFEVFTVNNLCTVKRSVDEVFIVKKENKWQLLISFKRGKCNEAHVTQFPGELLISSSDRNRIGIRNWILFHMRYATQSNVEKQTDRQTDGQSGQQNMQCSGIPMSHFYRCSVNK